jgi:phospholipid transport system substrate-binding protein
MYLIRYKTVFVILTLILCFPAHGKIGDSGATDVIETFNSALIESMKGADELGYSGRYKLLESVMKDSFALSFMLKTAVGRQWKKLEDEQKKRLFNIYSDWSIGNYADRFDHYSGERFEVSSEEAASQGTVTVTSHLIKTSGEKIDFNYKLRSVKDRWLIVDIHISGVSQLALTRSQFQSVIKTDGVDGLINKLKDKLEGFSSDKKE